MKHYFYADNDQQFGPFTIEELKSKRLKKSTLVWTDGMRDWTSADSIDEIKDILISEPPPLPKKINALATFETIQIKQTPIPVTSTTYDLTYEREIEATTFGVLLLVVPLAIKLSGAITFETEEGYRQATSLLAFASLVTRIGVTVYIVNIASRQNRDSTGWGWFAFLLPSIALIAIGQLKKLRLKIEIDGSLPINQQVSILLEKSNQLYSDNRYSECIEILNKAIELDSNVFEAIKLRGLAHLQMKSYDKSKIDFESLKENENFSAIANYYLGNIAILEHRREIAVSLWLKANENKNENAQSKLDLFHTFTGNYLLEFSQVVRKLKSDSSVEFTYINNSKYQGGISQIDQVEKISSLRTQIICYDNGIDIELKKLFKTYHIAIAYYEIENIVFNSTDKKFEFHLTDKKTLIFLLTDDYSDGLKLVCNEFVQATGKIPTASSYWAEK